MAASKDLPGLLTQLAWRMYFPAGLAPLTCELPHVAEGVLQAVCQLEAVHVAQAELDVGVHNQLGEAQDLQAGRRGGGDVDR